MQPLGDGSFITPSAYFGTTTVEVTTDSAGDLVFNDNFNSNVTLSSLVAGTSNSLQGAYAAGATIVEAGGVPVAISSTTADNASVLTVAKTPAGAQTGTVFTVAATPGAAAAMNGASITLSVNVTGRGLLVTHGGTTASVAGGTQVAVRLTGAPQSVALEMSDGQSVAVSAAGEGRLRFNASTEVFEVSQNTGAWVALTTATGSTLQAAYTAGATITVTAGNPVRVTNAAAVNSQLLNLTDVFQGSESGNVLVVSRSVVPTGATTWSGNLVAVSNIPTDTNNSTSSGHLVDVLHAPVAGAGTLTDTTTGIFVTMSPAAASAVNGIVVTMSANTVAASALSGALVVSSLMTLANVIYVAVANTSGTIFSIQYPASTVTTGATAINVDLRGVGTTSTKCGICFQGNIKPVNGVGDTSQGLVLNRTNGAISGNSTYTGTLITLANTPSANGQTLTESGNLVSIVHTPVLGGGTIVDTTIGINIQITPASSATVFGVSVTMGANTAAGGAGIVFGASAPAGMFDLLGPSNKSFIIRSGAAQALSLNTPGGANLLLNADGTTTVLNGSNLIFGTGTGTKFGTATTQKIGFWNTTPVVQPTWTAAGGTAATLATALAASGIIAIV